MFERLETIKGLPQIRSISHGAVICHQQRVVVLDQWAHRIGQLCGRRRAIFGQRNAAQCEDYFREYRLVDCQSRHGKRGQRGPMRWMCVTHSFHVGPLAVNQKVHGQFARRATFIQLPAFEISDRDQVVGHSSFASHGRRRQDPSIIQTHAHISI